MTSWVRRASKVLFVALDGLAKPLSGPRILIYHQIGGGSGFQMEVNPTDFRRQLDWLTEKADVKHLDDALADGEGTVLTFDDGYRSVYDVAFPMLLDRGLPFTLYLTTGPMESGVALREHPGAEPLTWEMTREMLDSQLLTVGAHTHTHPDLRSLNPDEVMEELSVSDEVILQRTGIRPRHFAYPWGYWAVDADRVVRSRYETAALGAPRPRRRETEGYLRYRLPIQLSDGMTFFRRRVRGGLLFEESLRRRLHGYAGP